MDVWEDDIDTEIDPLLPDDDPKDLDFNIAETETGKLSDSDCEQPQEPKPKKRKYEKLKSYSCCECGIEFRTKLDKEKHCIKFHVAQCEKCDAWVKDLRQHTRRMHMKRRHKCPLCEKPFTFPREVVAHMESVHNQESDQKELVNCDICDKAVMRKGLDAHKERLHSKKEYSCLFCTYTADSRMQIVRHTDAKHEKLSVECPVCSRDVFDLKKHLVRHQKEKYGCAKCDFKIGIKSELEIHYREKHLSVIDSLPKDFCVMINPSPSYYQVIQCPHCEYKSNNHGNVKKHIRTVHEEMKEKCDICGGMFKSAHAHKRAVHHKVRNYPCPFCDYKSINNYQLNNHIRVKHTDIDDRQECGICGKKVKNVDRHIELNHSTDPSIKAPKYFCEECPYKTHDKSAISAHVKATHIKEKIACKICHKMVIQCKLGSHMKCHRDNKFSCIPCVRTFRERRDLGKHILYQHRHHRHRCEFCKRNDVTDYLAHVKYNHKDVDWRKLVIPNCDKIILACIVKLLDEKFLYMGETDETEIRIKPVLQLLKEKGQLNKEDLEPLGFNFSMDESSSAQADRNINSDDGNSNNCSEDGEINSNHINVVEVKEEVDVINVKQEVMDDPEDECEDALTLEITKVETVQV